MSDESQAVPQPTPLHQVKSNKQTEASKAAEEQSVQPQITKEDAQSVLIRSLLEREARQAKKDIEIENQNEARAKQRAFNAKNRNEKSFAKQQRCKHLKGGKVKSKTGVKDYALFHHTYIDKSQLVGCFICKMRWKPGDTPEYLVRNGRRIRNHTKIGWLEVNQLFSDSSNTPSMSEIPQTMNEVEFAGGEDIGPAEAQ